MTAPPKTLILGIGNILLADEGIGVHIVRRLLTLHPNLPNVDFVDGGTLSFMLADAIAQATNLIVIDAAELHAPAGTIRLFSGDAMDNFLYQNRRRSVHEVGLMDLLAIARLSGQLPAQRALIGVQPQSITTWSDQPTPPVLAAIPSACAMIQDLLKRWCP